MIDHAKSFLTAFGGNRCLASGSLSVVARAAKLAIDSDPTTRILIFNDETSQQVELDLRGSLEDVLARVEKPSEADSAASNGSQQSALPTKTPQTEAPRGPGRPKLGVVAREVTLLPRHWSWLNLQPGGASVALRKLVEEARRTNVNGDRVRQAQEAAYRFMSAMAGDEPGFEGATRALFAGNAVVFEQLTTSWPADIRDHARMVAKPAFPLPKTSE